jgi:oligopeptide transport system substrate-binding protein
MDRRGSSRRHSAVVTLLSVLVLGGVGITAISPAWATPYHRHNASSRNAGSSNSTITAAISSDPPSLDPAKGFDPTSWSFIHATFVTLLTFNNAIQIVPWGAESMPKVSDGGRVYTFRLRPGLKFSDGEKVTAQTYADGIDRILNPKTKSLVMAFYEIIDGATSYSNGNAKSVSGIRVIGTNTISFTLTRPDRTFLDIMAIPNAAAVPPKVIAKHSSTFGLSPVGDGPYIVQSYIPGREITLVRNKSYFDAKSVSTGKIEITIGLSPETEVLRVENGSTDVMMDNLPTPSYISLHNNSRYAKYLNHFTAIADNYVALNMRKSPFTNQLVREAAAYAVNGSQVLRSIAGMGSLLTQILAPGMPGFDPSVKPLPYDPAKAKRLLKQAGYPNGKGIPTLTFAVATGGFTAGANVAEVVQEDLEQVGFHVQLKVSAPGAFLSSIGEYPLTMGIYGIDYPDPYDLIASQFACSEIAAGNNWQFYCNHAVDETLASSLSLPLNKAIPVYRKLQTKIFSAFPWIPLYYQELWYFVNPKVTGFGANALYPFLFAEWRV